MDKMLLTLLVFLSSVGASANVPYYRCIDANGKTLFTDRQCDELAHPANVGGGKVVDPQSTNPVDPTDKKEQTIRMPDKIDMPHQKAPDSIKPMP